MHSGNRWQLGHRPALDGLRGLAILFVLLAHFDNPNTNPFTGAGAVGVTVFFTLSGFLITSLLLDERVRTGATSLRAFYVRRARRLLPALAVVLAIVVLLQWAGKPLGVTRGMGSSVAVYVSNYWQLAHPAHNALSHTWSLAIEEQFYLVWPALFLLGLRWGRRGVVAIGGSLAVVSIVAVLTTSGQMQQWGSVQRAWSLLAGCLLAVWMSGRPEGTGSRAVANAAVVALVPLTILDGSIPESVYLLGVPILAAFALWAAAQRADVGWLEGRVLRWFGRRSYGIYLWHYVVIYALPVNQSSGWLAMNLLVRLPLSLLLAEASWRLVESRFQRRRQSQATSPQVPVSAGGGGAVVPSS